jgi:hypothetical protein
MTNARDRHDNTRITYRNEAAKAAGGHPKGYTIWPVTAGELTQPQDGSWFERTTGWEAWRNGKPDELLGVFKVHERNSFGVLQTAQDACQACWKDVEEGGARQQLDIVEVVTGDRFHYPFDPTVFTLDAGKVYLDHAQIYAVVENYRRDRCIPVGRTDSVRRQMNREHNRRNFIALGSRGQRKFHVGDVAVYASYGQATVEEVTGMTEEHMGELIRQQDQEARRSPERAPERKVPDDLLYYINQFLDLLRADTAALPGNTSGGGHREDLLYASEQLHDLLGTRYADCDESDLREELAALYGRPRNSSRDSSDG